MGRLVLSLVQCGRLLLLVGRNSHKAETGTVGPVNSVATCDRNRVWPCFGDRFQIAGQRGNCAVSEISLPAAPVFCRHRVVAFD